MAPEEALIRLGRALRERDYHFVTVTPTTHARVNAREPRSPASLRDIFGWSRPFTRDALPAPLWELLEAAGAVTGSNGAFRSEVRYSSLGGDLFVHSAYPTLEADAVFFGPDTYRFCAAIGEAGIGAKRVVDIGCGSGAGGIVAGRSAGTVVLADVNEKALAYSRVNAALAGLTAVEFIRSDVLAQVDGAFDLIVANPPYMRDELHRTYRDGGGAFGEGLSLRIVREALDRLSPGGTLLLYTGAPVVEGRDVFLEAVRPLVREVTTDFAYTEVDPDVFGDELERAGYEAVDRIAAVILRVTRPAT